MNNKINSYLKILKHSSTLATWINFTVKFGGFSVILPLALTSFNSNELRIWLVFQYLTGLIIVFDLGLSQTLSRVYSYCAGGAQDLKIGKFGKIISIGKGDINWNLVKSTYLISKKIYLVISVLVLVGLLLSFDLIMEDASNQYTDKNSLYISYVVICILLCVKLYGNLFSSILLGFNKVVVLNYWDALFGLLALLSTSLALIIYKNVLVVTIVYTTWYSVIVLRNYYLSYKHCLSHFKKHQSLFNQKINDIGSITFQASWKTFFGIFFGFGIIQITTLIVQNLETVTVAASFLFTIRVIQFIVDFSRAPLYSKLPELTILMAKGNIKKLLGTAKKGIRLSVWSYVVVLTIVVLFSNYFIDFLNSETKFLSKDLFLLIGIAFLIERICSMYSQIYGLTNHIVWHYVNLITGIIYCSFYILLYHYFNLGILAFPISLIISYLSYNLWYSIKLVYNEFNINILDFIFKPIAIPVILLVSYYLYLL